MRKFCSFPPVKVLVKDPYHYMEDAKDGDLDKWMREEVQVWEKEISSYGEEIKEFRSTLEKSVKFLTWGAPQRIGSYYYWGINDGVKNHSVKYRSQKNAEPNDEDKQLFFDPNTFSEDGSVSLGSYSVTEDDKYCVLSIHTSGSDWTQFDVYDISETPFTKMESLKKIKFSHPRFTKDWKGFFYSRYDRQGDIGADKDVHSKALENMMLCYHKIGTPQEQDLVLLRAGQHVTYEGKHLDQTPFYTSNVMVSCSTSTCGTYLIVSSSDSCDHKNGLFLVDMEGSKNFSEFYHKKKKSFQDLIVPVKKKIESGIYFQWNIGTTAMFITNQDAPNRKLISFDIKKYLAEFQAAKDPDTEKLFQECSKLVIEEEKDAVLEECDQIHKTKSVVEYTRDVHSELFLLDLEKYYKTFLTNDIVKKTIDLPSVGTVAGSSCHRDDPDLYILFASWISPYQVVKYHISEELSSSAFFQPKVPVDISTMKSKQIFYQSKDGTRIPMFLIWDGRNDLKEKKTILYGYGGFNISILPSFSLSRLLWCQTYGGIYAIANIRGGGEYGEKWHEAGKKLKKQNVFDDFISAAKYLISEKYCSQSSLGIRGASNGGLLVAAVANQAPELFGCVIADVGVMDMLRFHKHTVGHFWVSDYGSSDNPEDFENLLTYSPLHNIKVKKIDGKHVQYPTILAVTSSHDDRVVPSHSFKYIAELQHTIGKQDFQKNRLLLRVEMKSGHGGGLPLKQILQQSAECYCFMAHHLK